MAPFQYMVVFLRDASTPKQALIDEAIGAVGAFIQECGEDESPYTCCGIEEFESDFAMVLIDN